MELFTTVQTLSGLSSVAHTAPSDRGRCVEYVKTLAMRVANSHPSSVTVTHSPSVSSSHTTQKKQKKKHTSLSWKDEGEKKALSKHSAQTATGGTKSCSQRCLDMCSYVNERPWVANHLARVLNLFTIKWPCLYFNLHLFVGWSNSISFIFTMSGKTINPLLLPFFSWANANGTHPPHDVPSGVQKI